MVGTALIWLLLTVLRSARLCERNEVSWLAECLLASQRRYYIELVREAKIEV